MTTVIPPPLGLGRPSTKNKRYKLIISQHPVRARCCGFGEKDRRPIDPPPIIQLYIERSDGTLKNAIDDADNISLFVVQCDLFSEDGRESRNHVFNPSIAKGDTSATVTSGRLMTFEDPSPTKTLMGSNVSSGYQLCDANNQMGIFFVFQDLSVRIEGRFRLRFLFTNLSAGDPLTMSTQVSDEVMSEPFTVYSAKNFPGMTDSTLLSQCFAHQGIKISIRKEQRVRRISKSNYDKKDDESSKENNKKKQNYRRIDILDFL
ncbi:hypothetical protein K501DRAFT_254273 [Backusella circina FSU 941]|nr:hypothetical protein K501DRAFT_254273 [Backusella circina FSU 941]